MKSHALLDAAAKTNLAAALVAADKDAALLAKAEAVGRARVGRLTATPWRQDFARLNRAP